MRRSFVRLVLPLAVGLLAVPSSGAAQLGGWSLAATADVGGYVPLRQLGVNAGTGRQNQVLQITAEKQSTMTVGGGLVATSPSGGTMVRARFSSTTGGSTSGRWGVCGDPDTPLARGVLCEPVEVESQLQGFHVDLGFLRGSPTSLLRVSIHFGAGMRAYSFGSVECADPNPDRVVICEAASEIWAEDGGLSPFLMGGLRLLSELGPASLWVEAMDHVGPYRGGTARADGQIQNDLALSGGLTVRIF